MFQLTCQKQVYDTNSWLLDDDIDIIWHLWVCLWHKCVFHYFHIKVIIKSERAQLYLYWYSDLLLNLSILNNFRSSMLLSKRVRYAFHTIWLVFGISFYICCKIYVKFTLTRNTISEMVRDRAKLTQILDHKV